MRRWEWVSWAGWCGPLLRAPSPETKTDRRDSNLLKNVFSKKHDKATAVRRKSEIPRRSEMYCDTSMSRNISNALILKLNSKYLYIYVHRWYCRCLDGKTNRRSSEFEFDPCPLKKGLKMPWTPDTFIRGYIIHSASICAVESIGDTPLIGRARRRVAGIRLGSNAAVCVLIQA